MIRLEDFIVLRKLTVTEIRVQPNKVRATYTVEHLTGTKSSTELIYSYEDPYFDPGSDVDVNLASMMLAQVAINYGLFCEEIIFDGLYDPADRQFISQMMENTSREILCNKLLVPNEFLLPPYDGLKPQKRERYTQARITFVKTVWDPPGPANAGMRADNNKYAILSSGGKDSLLTYGLVSEFGQPYPIFINEAGRHWFTAVNAHRYFKRTEPNTSKPWCNSDRVFNWMLKQLPFIKPDYASIRADIYPVRLWTVAVFLFGVLPIVRRKGLGNILIGNEYDTTLKANLEGITHYCGLYDQSKYFDNALTRYYAQKKWAIRQFSLLRSLSELLIMKVLIKRYPHLQAHQISCHAAHEKEGRMYPCGKCEKCRRIIGMVKSLHEDPGNCGYSEEQIHNGLTALASRKVKQIGSDAAHLYYLLLQNGLIPENEFTNQMAHAHPEILKLRFDRERSTLSDLPDDIRSPLFGILSQYADGAVQRVDKIWRELELTPEFLNSTEYKYHV
jgi:hypothetical protein